MKAEMNRQAEQYIRQSKTKSRIVKIVTVLSVLVALITTYILILPGITMEYGMVCGLEEHQHSEACYTQGIVCGQEEREAVTTETVSMVCQVSPHTHTNECFNDSNVRICGTATELFHAHNSFCYDGEGNLICSLPDNAKHEHVESCYRTEQKLTCQEKETAGHQHTDACKTQTVASEPACGQTESAGHVHGETCYAPVLSCTLAQSEGHIHGESCSKVESTLVCTKGETPAHSHGTACYNDQNQLICELAEGGHTHEDTCYAQTTSLICGKEAGEGAHTHGADCYTTQLTCTIPEGEGAHEHTDDCYPMVESIICGMEAGQGAHVHQDACYTSTKLLDCTILHQHTDECFEKDRDGRACAICGIDEVQEHIHGEACREVITSTIEGHTHTEECNGSVQLCQLAEHTHVDACYPQEEAVVTATPEPTATVAPASEPAVTAEVTATITPAPAVQQEETIYLCGIPEHRHSADCLDETGALVCGYAMDHLHGELCLVDLTNATFYCGLQEHLHGALCFDATGSLICSVEPEHRHGYECLEDPDAIQYYCGMEEHFHGELCYDENDLLTCNETEHFHSADCRYACNKEEHTHSHTAAGGVMLLSLEEVSGCYDADGNLICTLDEHVHSEACNTADSSVLNTRNDQLMTLEESANTALQFDPYITGSKATVEGMAGNGANYDSATQKYSTTLQLSYQLPNSTLKSNPNLVYDLAEGVVPNANDIGRELPVMNGNTSMGTWKIVQMGDRYQIQITISDDYLNKADASANSTGTLSFEAQLDSELVQEDGSIEIPVTSNQEIVIPESNITYPNTNERPGYDISSNKYMSKQEGNCLYYTVQVSSRQGTPGDIQLVDQLGLSGIGVASNGITVESITKTVDYQPAEVPNVQPQIQDNGSGKTISMTLPQLEANSYYEITYKVQLDNPASLKVDAKVDNSVTVSSPSGGDPDITHTTNSGTYTYSPDVLKKTGSYSKDTDVVTWTMTVNKDGLNIAGYQLTDTMFGSILANTFVVKDQNGNQIQDGSYTIQYGENNKITGIVFNGSNGNENKNQYQIEYQTKPTQNFGGAYSETNQVTLQKDSDTVTKEANAWVDRPEYMEKKNTGYAENPDNANERIVSWSNSITIPENGLSENLVVADTLNNNQYHTMTVDQVKALYQNLQQQPWFNAVVGQKLILTDKNYQTHEITSPDQLNNLSVDGFIKFSYELDHTLLENYKGQNLLYTYQTTANIANVAQNTTGYFGNELKVNEKSVSAQYEYRNIQIRPVQKVGHNYNGDLTTFESTEKSLKWVVQICMKQNSNKVVVTDKLPVPYVELKDIVLPVGNGTLTLGAQQGDGTYQLVFTDGNASGDNEMNASFSGSYNPNTGEIQLTITKNSDSRFFKPFNGQWYENQTPPCEGLINLEFNCDVKSLPPADENNQIKLTNTVDVDVDDQEHGSASHTYQTTLKELVVKKDRNGSDAAVTDNHEITDQKIKWTVEVYQDKAYDSLIITDTLPEGLVLDYIETGSWGGNTKIYPNGDICTITNDGAHDLDIFEAKYNTGSRQIEVTAHIADAISKNYDSSVYGEGKTLKMTVYCTITDEYIGIIPGSNEDIQKSFEFKNQVSVQAKEQPTDEPVDYGSDEQTTKGTVKYTKPVRKTDLNGSSNPSSITTQTGEVGWLVEIKQQAAYEKIIVTDTLDPAQVDLSNIQIRDQWGNYASFASVGTADANGLISLVIDSNTTNQNNLNATGTYNPATGQVWIELSAKDPNNNNGIYGNGKTIVLRYNCKLKDDLMPDVASGELNAGAYAINNQVQVELDDQLYTASQQQNVSVNIPFTAGAKSHEWNDGMGELFYTADLNPMAMDLNPQGDKLTVEDTLKFHSGDENNIFLKENTVKLYYADYDQYGNPVFDENGRLKKGDLVPFTEWEMSYEESRNQYNTNEKYRVMNMRVPDGKALVLEYQYKVTMPSTSNNQTIPQANNTVTIKEAPNYSFSHQTSYDDKWYSGSASMTIETDSYSITKYDASNQALTLSGTEFDVYAWNSGSQSFEKLYTYTTDGFGTINITPNGTGGSPQYSENTAYYVVETKPTFGYTLPAGENKYYFYWQGEENGTFNGPDDFINQYRPVNLKGGAMLNIANTKKSTFVAIQKEWKDQNGNTLTEGLPDHVTVSLKRYAVKADEWNEELYNKGELTNVENKVTLQVCDGNNQLGKQMEYLVPVGATLYFDIEVSRNEQNIYVIQHMPVFSAPVVYTGSETTGEGNDMKCTYHYQVRVDRATSLTAKLKRLDSNEYYNGNNFGDYLNFTNVRTEGGVYVATPEAFAALEQYKDDTFGKTQNLYAAGDWYASWDNLDIEKTVDGVNYHYKYYIEEVPVDGFSSTITGGSNDDGGMFVITNTKDDSHRTYTAIRVQKKWLDAAGQPVTDTANMPPIEVQLYQKDMLTGNEKLIVDSNGAGITLNENSQWEYNYKNLPLQAFRQGVLVENYTYRVTEVVPEGYSVTFEVLDSNGNPLTGSNANADLTGGTVMMINSAQNSTNVVARKEWAGGVPSGDVKVELQLSRKVYKNGVYMDAPIDASEGITTTVTLPANNQWEYTWTDLRVVDDEKNSYQYDVTETKVTINGVDVTAQYEQEKTTHNGITTITNKTASVALRLQKRWKNASGQDAAVDEAKTVYLKLYQNNSDITAQLTADQLADGVQLTGDSEKYLVLNTAEGSALGEISIVDLEKGDGIVYTVKEFILQDGQYQEAAPQVIYGSDASASGMTDSGIVQVINTSEEPLTGLTVTKQWKNANGEMLTSGMPDSVQFYLWRTTENASTGVTCSQCNQSVNSTSDHLAVCGQHYTCQSGYNDAQHQLCTCNQYLCQGDHSNCNANQTVTLTFVAVHNYQENGEQKSERFEKKVENIPLNANVNWKAYTTLTDMDEQPGGSPQYTYNGQTFDGNGSNNGSAWLFEANLTATVSGEVVHTFSTSGENQKANVTHEVTINGTAYALYSVDGQSVDIPADAVKVQDAPYTISSANGWQTIIADLPAKDTNGNTYRYYVEEIETTGFTASYDGIGVTLEGENPAVTVTNTQNEVTPPEPETTQLTVSKLWQDENGATLTDHPETVQFKLYRKTADGTVEVVQENEADKLYTLPNVSNGQWEITITDLPVANDQGQFYTYYVVEEPVEGYAASYNKQGTVTVDGADLVAGEADNGSVTIINKPVPTTVVSASKVWKDEDGNTSAAPAGASVSLQLYRNTLTEEQWKQFVQEQQQTDTPEDPGDEPADMVTLTFELVDTTMGSQSIGQLEYICPKNGELELCISYGGTATLWDLQTSIQSASYIGRVPSENRIIIPLKAVDTSESYTYTIKYSRSEALNLSDWSIELLSADSTYAIQRSDSLTHPGADTVAIGDPVILQNGTWSYTWPAQPQQNGTEYYYYYVKETSVPSGYTASYDYSWDETTGNYSYTVTNTKLPGAEPVKGSLTVNKEWVNTSASTVQFKLYRIARPKAVQGQAATYASVNFKIQQGSIYTEFSNVNAFFPADATVTWKPTWNFPGDWHPSDQDEEGNARDPKNTVTYNNGNNLFSEGNRMADRYVYSFAMPVGNGGNVVWTTDNSGYTNDKPGAGSTGQNIYQIHYWSNEFELDNEGTRELVNTYDLSSSLTIDDLVFEDENFTYRYVVEEVGSGYTVSYSYSGSSPTQQQATIINYVPPKMKIKVEKQWYNSANQPMDAPANYYIKYNLVGSWSNKELELWPDESGQWVQEVTDVLFDGQSMYVEEIGVYDGSGKDVSQLFKVEYSEDGSTWYSTTGSTNNELVREPTDAQDTIFYIRNTLHPTYVLPETGGIGTHLYTGAGALLICVALSLLYRRNKRKRRADA